MTRTRIIFLAIVLAFGVTVERPAEGAVRGYFTQAELDQMLAPVALYPDTVLSHVLIAATYPLEVMQAARWSRNHPGLSGQDAVRAVEYRDWDASVQALVAFPELLERMDRDIEWTQRLGDAFLMQEDQLVDAIQHLRDQAYSQGHLRSNDRVRVVRESRYIYIEPARTQVVYVPYYDPRVVYGSWRWAGHPPVYWQRPHGSRVSVSFHWGSGYRVHSGFYFSSFSWSQRQVVVVNHHHHHYYPGHRQSRKFHSGRDVAGYQHARRWQHNPQHRRGVDYRPGVDRQRFADNTARSSSGQRGSDSRLARSAERRGSVASSRGSSDANSSERSTSRDVSERLQRSGQTRSTNPASRSTRESSRSTTERTTRSADQTRQRLEQRSRQSASAADSGSRNPATRAPRRNSGSDSGGSNERIDVPFNRSSSPDRRGSRATATPRAGGGGERSERSAGTRDAASSRRASPPASRAGTSARARSEAATPRSNREASRGSAGQRSSGVRNEARSASRSGSTSRSTSRSTRESAPTASRSASGSSQHSSRQSSRQSNDLRAAAGSTRQARGERSDQSRSRQRDRR